MLKNEAGAEQNAPGFFTDVYSEPDRKEIPQWSAFAMPEGEGFLIVDVEPPVQR